MKILSFGRVLTLGVGVGIGYLLGNREGRAQAEEAARQAQRSIQQFWNDPKTQERVHETSGRMADVVKEKAPALSGVADTAADMLDKSTGYDSNESPEQSNSPNATPGNEKAGHEKKHVNGDTISDPSESLEEEGGTTATRR